MKKVITKPAVGVMILGFAALIWCGFQTSFAGPITVFATPVVSRGTNGLCPGGFTGYVTYTKTAAQGWGWSPTNTLHTATDTNRTDTKVEFVGKLSDSGCNQTTVTVPQPCPSNKYRFTIYFPNNVPTNSYPIVLNGFAP